MVNDKSFRGQIRSIFFLPSKLQQTRNLIFENEEKAIRKIGSWKCPCGHMNTIYHHPPPSPYPLGIMCCRSCSAEWQEALKVDTSIMGEEHTVKIHEFIDLFHTCERTSKKPTRVIAASVLASKNSSWGYICGHEGCGLTGRLVKRKAPTGSRRDVDGANAAARTQILELGNGRRKLCDCGGGLLQPNRYTIFEVMKVCPLAEAVSVKESRMESVDSDFAPVMKSVPSVLVDASKGGDDAGAAMMSGANGMG